MLDSFKLKLVLWFALLALLPLAVAFYGYDTLAQRSETRRVDASQEAALRAAVAEYSARVNAASVTAQRLAVSSRLQNALRTHDANALVGLLANVPGATVDGPGVHVGVRHGPVAAVRTVAVLEGTHTLGRVSVAVTLDARVLQELGGGVAPGSRLVVVRGGAIVKGSNAGARIALGPGRAARVRVGHTEFRALETPPLAVPQDLSLAVLSPQAAIDSAARSDELRILAALAASLLLFALVTYFLGRSIVGTLRRLAEAANAIAQGRLGERVDVRGRDEFAQLSQAFNGMAAQLEQRLVELEAERDRVRHATARFGETLVATHDPDQLLRVVVESAVEATGAIGGVVVGREGELVRAGDPDAGLERIAFPLRAGDFDFGSLVISGVFDSEQVEMAASLAAQAVVALDNAHLHLIVEQQALVDSLTGLANRRSLEERLRSDLARAARFDEHVCVVLADIDDFKQTNDQYGHPFGDEVLKVFAEALRGTVRESDVAGRWGGEEFALILSGTDGTGGARFAERARAAIESRTLRAPNGDEVQVSASFGVAAYPESQTVVELLAAADSALYEAKRDGKNRVVVSVESVRI